MRTRTITVSDDYVPTINIGRQGENAVSQVVFDVSSLITDYGAGTGTVVVQRPGESTTYQHDDTAQSGDTVTWTVSSADTERAGTGMVQLFWIVNNAIAKTITYQTYIEAALMNPTDAPVSEGGWISEEIGTLANLTTTEKSNLVGAINEVNADVSDLKEEFDNFVGLSDDVKLALLQIASKVAYIDDDGQDYYDALYDALYPPANLVSISAVYTQSGTVYDTDSLDSLKSDLVVTALYDNQTTQTVTSYTLSGTLVAGTSTITVTYGGKTTTFTVTVSESRVPSGYTAYDYIKIISNSESNIRGRGMKTDIQLVPTYSLETSVKYPTGQTHTESTCLMGTRNGQGGTKAFGLFVKPSETKLGYWFNGTDTTTTIPFPAGSVNTIKLKPVGKSESYPTYASIEVNGTDYSTGNTTTSATWPAWYGLMQYQISATALNGYDAWSSLIEQGEIVIKNYQGILLYDFIPAYNGIYYGFYESVNGVFYYDETYHSEYTCGNWE